LYFRFERELSTEHATDLYNFCENNISDLTDLAIEMYDIVKALLVETVRRYGGDEKSLQEGPRSTLAQRYRTPKKQSKDKSPVQTSDNAMGSSLPSESCVASTGMDVLAAAALGHDQLQGGLRPQATRLGTDLVSHEAVETPAAIYGVQAQCQVQRSETTQSAFGGLHVPVAGIGQVEAYEPGSSSCGSQHEFAVETQARSDPGAQNEGLSDTAVDGRERGFLVPGSHHQPHDSQAWASGVGHPASRLNTTALGLQNEGTFTDQAPGPASYEAGSTSSTTYGQDVQPLWQMYPNQRSPTISDASFGPRVPVAAAGQVQVNTSGIRTYNPQHHSTQDTQTQQQLSGTEVFMTATNQRVFTEPIQMRPDIGPSWHRATTMPRPALDGVETPLYDFYQNGITSDQNMMMSNQEGDFWSLDWVDIA
jgi:hypothetical protein